MEPATVHTLVIIVTSICASAILVIPLLIYAYMRWRSYLLHQAISININSPLMNVTQEDYSVIETDKVCIRCQIPITSYRIITLGNVCDKCFPVYKCHYCDNEADKDLFNNNRRKVCCACFT